MKIKYWLCSARPSTLWVGIGPIWVGYLMAVNYLETYNFWLNGMIVFCVLCIQIATHFFNDALDFLKGADGAFRIGPHRMAQKGYLSTRHLMQAGGGCLVLAMLLGVYLVGQGGWSVFIVGIISCALAYLYTGGPYPLAYTGLSDLFVILFFGAIPVSFVFFLNTGFWNMECLIAGVQCGFLALSLLLVNHLRDFKADSRVGKKTLVVRWGISFGIIEWTFVRYVPYLLSLYWFFKGKHLTAFLPFLLFPFSFVLHYFLLKALYKNSIYQKLLKMTCWYHFLFTLLLSMSFLI